MGERTKTNTVWFIEVRRVGRWYRESVNYSTLDAAREIAADYERIRGKETTRIIEVTTTETRVVVTP